LQIVGGYEFYPSTGGPGRAHAPRWRQPAGGGATAAAVQHGFGAGVLHLPLELHQNDEKPTANSTVSSRGGDEASGWRTAEDRGGVSTARATRRCGARRRKQATRSFSSPPCGSPEGVHDGGEVAAERSNDGGAARVRRRRRGAAGELGFGAKAARVGRRLK
jgi:hypothetical protein